MRSAKVVLFTIFLFALLACSNEGIIIDAPIGVDPIGNESWAPGNGTDVQEEEIRNALIDGIQIIRSVELRNNGIDIYVNNDLAFSDLEQIMTLLDKKSSWSAMLTINTDQGLRYVYQKDTEAYWNAVSWPGDTFPFCFPTDFAEPPFYGEFSPISPKSQFSYEDIKIFHDELNIPLNARIGETCSRLGTPNNAYLKYDDYYNSYVIHTEFDFGEIIFFSHIYGGNTISIMTDTIEGPRNTKVGDDAEIILNSFYREKDLVLVDGTNNIYSLYYEIIPDSIFVRSGSMVMDDKSKVMEIHYTDGIYTLSFTIESGLVTAFTVRTGDIGM